MAIPFHPSMPVRQYFDLLEKSDVRYEYLEGEVVERAAASIRHNRITMNIGARLWQQLRGKDCTVAQSDQLVKDELSSRFLFPDLVVHCKDGRKDQGFVEAVLDPVVVVEVLSASTERLDRTKKFESYSRMGSLRELLLVSQERKVVEHFRRGAADEEWRMKPLFEDEHEVELASIGCQLLVGEIYEGVES